MGNDGFALNDHNQSSEETIFSTALQLPSAAERAAYLDAACGGDSSLRERVDGLLKAQPSLGEFMEHLPRADSGSPPNAVRAAIPSEEGPGKRIGRYKL